MNEQGIEFCRCISADLYVNISKLCRLVSQGDLTMMRPSTQQITADGWM